jgi:hypothetical protein
MPPTLFIVPECAEMHRTLLRHLAGKGVEMGLHLHPQSFDAHQYEKYLGEYERDEQLGLIMEARDRFAQSMGTNPRSFRSGNFSANDDTFPVLDFLGFRQGSVSDPGRNTPGFAATWNGAIPDPHWASGDDRLTKGELSFLEVPVTTDPGRLQPNGFPYELRIENGGVVDWQMPIIDRFLERVKQTDVEMPCLCFFTHNFIDYSEQESDQFLTLSGVVDYLRDLDGCDIVPATMEGVRETFVERFGEP